MAPAIQGLNICMWETQHISTWVTFRFNVAIFLRIILSLTPITSHTKPYSSVYYMPGKKSHYNSKTGSFPHSPGRYPASLLPKTFQIIHNHVYARYFFVIDLKWANFDIVSSLTRASSQSNANKISREDCLSIPEAFVD